MLFTIQENDDCAILLSKEMGFPAFGILGTNFMVEHGWIIDLGTQEITISLPSLPTDDFRNREARKRLTEVAHRCGWRSERVMSHVFERYCGCSAIEWLRSEQARSSERV